MSTKWDKFFEPFSTLDLWDMLRNFPKIAGPWGERFTDEQRVPHLFSRRALQLHHTMDEDHMNTGIVAEVWGPLLDGQWIWKAGYTCRHANTKEEGMQLADLELARLHYRLVSTRQDE